jgi:hypothetical protein
MSAIAGILALIILLIFIAAFAVLTPRIRRGGVVRLRPLPGYQAAGEAIAEAAEQGRTTHLSAGPSPGVDGTGVTADTLAGLDVMGRLARRCAATGTQVLGTTGSALAFPLAENVVRSAYASVGRLDEVPLVGVPRPVSTTVTLEGGAQGVRMLTHGDSLAYAAAAADLSETAGVSNATLIGQWGREYLLVSEAQQRAGVRSVAGASSPEALAPMMIGADHTLIGEEIYVGGAYLDADPAHLSSLLAQDTVRVLLIVLIIGGVLLATVLPGVSIPSLLGLVSSP